MGQKYDFQFIMDIFLQIFLFSMLQLICVRNSHFIGFWTSVEFLQGIRYINDNVSKIISSHLRLNWKTFVQIEMK
jgi:hypothetical protein